MHKLIHRYQHTAYLDSANNIDQLAEDHGEEIAFAGRSNAGKSSAINVICQQRALARTSKTPGRTQMINFFSVDETHRLVDLPGYGFAKVPEKVKKHWQSVLEYYFSHRQSLKGVILMIDIRHPLKPFDEMMLEWCHHHKIPLHILLTKADKLKSGAAKTQLLTLNKLLKSKDYSASVQLFSALKYQGIPEVHQILEQWFTFEEPISSEKELPSSA